MVSEGANSADLVVAIGASAGGLQALEEFFRDMPEQPGMAFVVVQHLSPDYKSLMVELMSRCTVLKVRRVTDGMTLENNAIHLIPPKKNMTLSGGTLLLTDQLTERGVNLPIDIFFRSVAVEAEDRAVGIVLSGTGSDGTLGIRAIKGAGGMVMVQDPETAKFDGMPRSALATRMVDFALAPNDLRAKLLQYADYPAVHHAEPDQLPSVQSVFRLLRNQFDVDFSKYRSSTFSRRVEKRMQLNQIADLDTYVEVLKRDPGEVSALYQDALIGVTRFFRDDDGFAVLEDQLRVELAAHEPGHDFRVWSVACSTGEEPYSLAILLNELARELDISIRFKIFATDIDRVALRTASAGVYPESIAVDVPRPLLERYFVHGSGTYSVRESLRKQVIFSYHNVLVDPPFNRLNLASLRNMMIYLEVGAQQTVLRHLSFALQPTGVLFLGPSETVGDLASDFESLNHRWKLYKRRPGRRTALPDPTYLPVRTQRPEPLAFPSTPSRTAYAERLLFKELMARYAPPTLVIDDRHQVVMSFGTVAEYVQLPAGTINLDLAAMTEGPLGVVISGALHRARSEGKPVRYLDIEVGREGARRRVDLVVDTFGSASQTTPLYAVVFQPVGERENDTGGTSVVDMPPQQHLHDLQQELQYTKESHQATIEELETSNEELQATNEELLSSNEELQSTNEELQSVNEELVTVNAEYQQKIDELVQLNTDMDNFFTSSGTGTLFLDSELRIRKFSPAVGRHFNLVATDLNRPLNHFSFGLDYSDFFEDARDVLETLEDKAREVPSADGRWFLVKIAPYHSASSGVNGVVVTFVDATERRASEAQLEEYRTALAELRGHKPVNVLLVEDDEAQAALMSAALEASDQVGEVWIADSGAAALEVLSADRGVELVLLDLGLPDIHGFDVLQEVKKNPRLKTLPVVVVSAGADPADVRRAYELQASGYVTKPDVIEQLGAVVRRVNDYWFSVVRLPPAPGDEHS